MTELTQENTTSEPREKNTSSRLRQKQQRRPEQEPWIKSDKRRQAEDRQQNLQHKGSKETTRTNPFLENPIFIMWQANWGQSYEQISEFFYL
jgi:hypothetical protein